MVKKINTIISMFCIISALVVIMVGCSYLNEESEVDAKGIYLFNLNPDGIITSVDRRFDSELKELIGYRLTEHPIDFDDIDSAIIRI